MRKGFERTLLIVLSRVCGVGMQRVLVKMGILCGIYLWVIWSVIVRLLSQCHLS